MRIVTKSFKKSNEIKNAHQGSITDSEAKDIVLGLNSADEKILDLSLQIVPVQLTLYKKLKIQAQEIGVVLHRKLTSGEKQKKQQEFSNILQQCQQCKKWLTEFDEQLAMTANIFYQQTNLDKALRYNQQSLAICQLVYGSESRQVADRVSMIGQILSDQGKYEQALSNYEIVLQIRKKEFGEASHQVALVMSGKGVVFRLQGHYQNALEQFKQALAILNSLSDKHDFEMASVLLNMGNVFSGQHKLDHALDCYQKALSLIQTGSGDHKAILAMVTENIGIILSKQGKYKLADENFQQVLVIRESIFGKRGGPVASTYINIGYNYLDQGAYNQAYLNYQKAHDIFLEKFGDSSLQVSETHNNLGIVLAKQNKYEQALKHYLQSLNIRKKLCGEDNHLYADTLIQIARIYAEQGKFADAYKHYQQALITYQKIFGLLSNKVAAIFNDLGNLLRRERRYKEAFAAFVQCLDIEISLIGEKSDSAAIAYMNIGNVLVDEGNYEEGLKFYEKALTIEKSLGGEDNSHLIIKLHNIAALFVAQRKYEYAIKFYSEALIKSERIHGPQHYSSCDTRWGLASAHHKFAVTLEDKAADEHYHLAIKNYEVLLKINNEILAMQYQKLCIYDWVGHIELLLKLANSYAEQHRVTQAGLLFYSQIKAYPKVSPIVILYFSSQALKYLKYYDDHKEKVIELYQLRSQIGYRQQRFSFAIKNLQKALELDPEKETYQRQLLRWQKERSDQINSSDRDIYALLENSQDSYVKIQLLILEELQSRKEISEGIKNRITELLIKIISMLDIAFSRFIVKGIYQVNRFTENQELYYPVTESHVALRKILQSKNIINDNTGEEKSKVSLDKNYGYLYELLIQEQPFYYYSKKNNQKRPGLWQQSWLEKVVAISNNAKHIGLTQQEIKDELMEKMGTFKKTSLRIMIDYVESRFYPWSFFENLKQISDLPDEKLIELSNNIYAQLTEKQYLSKGAVVHPLAKQYSEAIRKQVDEAEKIKLEEKFHQQLECDLSKQFHSYLDIICKRLLMRVSQSTSLTIGSDKQVDFQSLLEKSLACVSKIVCCLCETKKSVKSVAKFPLKESMNSQLTNAPQATLISVHKPFEVDEEIKQPAAFSKNDWIRYDLRVKAITHNYCHSHHEDKAAAYYLSVAEAIIKIQPSLGLHYYHKALYYYNFYGKPQEKLQCIYLALGNEYAAREMWLQAIKYLDQGMGKLNYDYAVKMAAQKIKYTHELVSVLKDVDLDLYSQLEHAQQQILYLEYLNLQLASDANNSYLQQGIQNIITEVVIKLRHLLDQGFARFVRKNIYSANDESLSIFNKSDFIKFYAFDSKDKMTDELTKRNIINTDIKMASLDRNFPGVYKLLIEAQLFSYKKASDSWLGEIIKLSNQVKHVGFDPFSASNYLDFLTNIQNLFKQAVSKTKEIIQVMFKQTASGQHYNRYQFFNLSESVELNGETADAQVRFSY